MTDSRDHYESKISHLLASNDPDEKRKAYSTCLQLLPCSGETAAWLGPLLVRTAFALEQQGFHSEARELYAAARSSEGVAEDLRANAAYRCGILQQIGGDLEGAIATYEEVAAQHAFPLVRQLAKYHLACLLLHTERFQEAVQRLDSLLAEEIPADLSAAQLQLLRAICLIKLNREAEIPEDLPALLPGAGAKIEAGTAGIWMNAAFHFEQHGQLELAKELYSRLAAMQDVPGEVLTNLHFRLGFVLECLGYYDDSCQEYQKALDSPHIFTAAQVQARWHLANLLYLAESYDTAFHHFASLRGASELTPEQRADVELKYGICLYRTNQLSEAKRHLEWFRQWAGRSDSDFDLKADLVLAELCQRERDVQGARECLTRIIHHPGAERLMKTAALNSLERLTS